MKYKKGDTVIFQEDKMPYTVIAASERYLVCTRKLNRRQDADILHGEVERGGYFTFTEAYKHLKDSPVYTIVDLVEGVRGTENLIFCMGFNTEKQCMDAIKRLETGVSELSTRNNIKLNIAKCTVN